MNLLTIHSSNMTVCICSFDEFYSFFIENVLKLTHEQHTKRLSHGSAKISQEANHVNESLLRQLYECFSSEDGRLSYDIMCNVLQTIVRSSSCCFSILVNVVSPRIDSLDILETARVHGQILQVFR